MNLLFRLFTPKSPCVNCITLGMCRAKLNNGDLRALASLLKECSLLSDYVVDSRINFPHKYGRYIKDIYNKKKFVKAVKYITTNIQFSPTLDEHELMPISEVNQIEDMLPILTHNSKDEIISGKPLWPPPRILKG